MSKKYNLKHNKERLDVEFWIDTTGKIHKYKGDMSEEVVSIHSAIASMLYPESNKPTDVLMRLGWVMVGSSVYSHPIIHAKPTQAQINTLYRIGQYKRLTFLHNGYYVPYDKYQILCK